jgi:ribosomal protein S18 acetylase RimI-like enzyme
MNMIRYLTDVNDVSPGELEGFFVEWLKPLTVEQHYTILKNSSHVVLGYDTEKSRVIGFINALSDGVNFAFIPMLEVLPEYQKRGIGSELIRIMLKELEHINCIDLTCDEDMQDYYKRFGMLKSHGMVLRRYMAKGE